MINIAQDALCEILKFACLRVSQMRTFALVSKQFYHLVQVHLVPFLCFTRSNTGKQVEQENFCHLKQFVTFTGKHQFIIPITTHEQIIKYLNMATMQTSTAIVKPMPVHFFNNEYVLIYAWGMLEKVYNIF